MQKERFVERILEAENLCDDLEDADANRLINWGINQVDVILAGITDEELAGKKINALMAVMRKINRLVGQANEKTALQWSQDLTVLHTLFVDAFGAENYRGSLTNTRNFEKYLTTLLPHEVLPHLLQWPNWSDSISKNTEGK